MTARAIQQIYMDSNATMPVRPAVAERVAHVLTETGNASSVHHHGRAARACIETARAQIAALAGTNPAYVFFNSGATEGNNTVLQSFRGQRILVSAIEHPSVLEVDPAAETIPVTSDGIIDLGALEKLLTTGTPPALVAVMLVNNETGVIQPVADIVRLVRRVSPNARVHCDAVQAAGRIPLDFSALQVDFMTLSAHKLGGVQGAGALIMAPGSSITPVMRGGGQERRQRPGTENIPGIAGFGLAADIAAADIPHMAGLATLRDQIEERLLAAEPRLRIFGRAAPRVGNTSQISLPGIAAETQLMALDLAGISVSSGSACASGKVTPSHVLRAMGATQAEAEGAVRLSLGWHSTENDIDAMIAAWLDMHARVKGKISA